MSFLPDCKNCKRKHDVYKPFAGEGMSKSSPCKPCLDSGLEEDGAPKLWVPINNITAQCFMGDDDATVDIVKQARGLA